MCVIVYKPKGERIDRQTVENCWTVNSDGAGYSVAINGVVKACKGFMSFKDYWRAIRPYCNEKSDLVLHFRITSTGRTCKAQTHPFKSNGNVPFKEQTTNEPLYYMNGTITGLNLIKGCNDTETLLKRYGGALSNDFNAVVDMLEALTGALWCVHAPDGRVYISEGFIESDGLFYSNLNHEYLNYWSDGLFSTQIDPSDIVDAKLLKRIGKITYKRLKGFINVNCSNCLCDYCDSCLMDAKTVKDIKDVLKGF